MSVDTCVVTWVYTIGSFFYWLDTHPAPLKSYEKSFVFLRKKMAHKKRGKSKVKGVQPLSLAGCFMDAYPDKSDSCNSRNAHC